jgi:hypothetical protein
VSPPSQAPPPPPPPLTRGERRRAFLREILGIVIGVLIALSLGAVASAIGWRIDGAAARDALSAELGEILGQAKERAMANDCIEGRLSTLGAVLDGAAASGTLPPLGDIGNPPFRTWSHGVWDSTISADIASHMDREDLDNLSGVYEFVTVLNHESQVEDDSWTALYALVGPGRPIAADEIVALRAALARARMAHRLIIISALRMQQIADAYDLPYDRGTVREIATPGMANRFCAALPPPAPGERYGQAPFRESFRRVQEDPIRKTD